MQIITISKTAEKKLLEITKNNAAVLLKLTKYGCSGKGYKFELLNQNLNSEDFIIIQNDKVQKKLFIESQSFMNLIGCNIDYKINDIGEEFVFNNPNAKSTCGCGKSFN